VDTVKSAGLDVCVVIQDVVVTTRMSLQHTAGLACSGDAGHHVEPIVCMWAAMLLFALCEWFQMQAVLWIDML
jgi:hypothetical protein